MAFTFDEGTANVAALSTEYTLNSSAITTKGCYQLFLGVHALANGDSLLVRVYEAVISGGTQRVTSMTISNAQGADGSMWDWPGLVLGNNADITVEQTSGVAIGNNLEFSIREVS